MFKKVDPRQNFPQMEKDVLEFWKEDKTFENSMKDGGRPAFSFYDGPPFATGLPHYGHVVASLIKDAVPRYWTMKGNRVDRRWGWDCHGLPVENLIEKELGIENKQAIEKMGIDKFNEACCGSVLRYAKEWKEFIPRVGRWVDMENDYKTMNWQFTESIWWVFSEIYKKGLVYEGYKAMHMCPRCETTLANFEVTQGYKDITDLSATVKFKLTKESAAVILNEAKRNEESRSIQEKTGSFGVPQDDDDVYILAWTTTPWTLPGNVALAVGKDIEYLLVEDKWIPVTKDIKKPFNTEILNGSNVIKTRYILAKSAFERFKDKFKNQEPEILKIFKGSDLVGLEYEPVFDYLQKIIKNNVTPRVLKKQGSNTPVDPFFAHNIDAYNKEEWKRLMEDSQKSLSEVFKFKQNAYKVYIADFVTTEEGTGVVHIAPAFGEDDMNLAREKKLPTVQHVSVNGRLSEDLAYSSWDDKMTEDDIKNHEEFIEIIKDKGESERAGKWQGLEVKPKRNPRETDEKIVKWLKGTNQLFASENYKHSYPHCWRCDTPLLNYASGSWFVEVTKIKDNLVKNNQQVNWVPGYIKDGRFGKWLEDARDWAVSRSRFWGAPLPIWKCEDCGEIEVIGSIDELREKTDKKITKFIFVRHGLSEHNILGINSNDEDKYHLVDEGKAQSEALAEKLKDAKIDVILCSPVLRAAETAEIVGEKLNLPVVKESKLKDSDFGSWNGLAIEELMKNEVYRNYRSLPVEEKYVFRKGGHGESRADVEKRVREFIKEANEKYAGKNILVVSHAVVGSMFHRIVDEVSVEKTSRFESSVPNASAAVYYVTEDGNKFDLHKPYIDAIELKCPKCGKPMKIVGDVFDCWFESGSMPYAQLHYPFENKEKFEKSFPADFIAEGIDQTRGWFYTLMVLATALFDKPAFKNVIVNGIVLAEDGQKMSKKLKNYPDPNLILEKYGADALRYYLFTSPVMKAENLRFSEKGVDEVLKRFILTLWNTYSFLVMNAELNKINPKDIATMQKSENLLDQWILSELNILIADVDMEMRNYDLVKASRPLRDFVDKLSNWYLRRSRKRFASDDMDDKLCAYQTLYYVLVTFTKLMAPFMPFLAEEIFRNLTDKESVHTEAFPEVGVEGVDDKLIQQMNLVRDVVTLGLAVRAGNRIKVRMPLSAIEIFREGLDSLDENLVEILKDELNVKSIKIVRDISAEEGWGVAEDGGIRVALNLTINEELELEGLARELIRQIQSMRKDAKYSRDAKIIVAYKKENGEKFDRMLGKWLDEIKKECLIEKFEEKNEMVESDFDKTGELVFDGGKVVLGVKFC